MRTVKLPELLRVQIMSWESLIASLPADHPARCHLEMALIELRAAEGALEPETIDVVPNANIDGEAKWISSN